MRLEPDETGELRLLLEDLSIVSVFVRRTRKGTVLSERDFENVMRRDSTPYDWARAWQAHRGGPAIKELVYAEVRITVPSYGPKSKSVRKRNPKAPNR